MRLNNHISWICFGWATNSFAVHYLCYYLLDMLLFSTSRDDAKECYRKYRTIVEVIYFITLSSLGAQFDKLYYHHIYLWVFTNLLLSIIL